MFNFKTTVTTALMFLLLSISASNATDNTTLKISILEFENAMETKNVDSILNFMPPKVMMVLAQKLNINIEQLQTALKDAMLNSMASITMFSFKMDLERAVSNETGTGRKYFLIPTTNTMTLENTKVLAKSQTLAFLDGGTWYLVRISEDQQIQLFKTAYPEFDNVTFPRGTTELLEN